MWSVAAATSGCGDNAAAGASIFGSQGVLDHRHFGDAIHNRCVAAIIDADVVFWNNASVSVNQDFAGGITAAADPRSGTAARNYSRRQCCDRKWVAAGWQIQNLALRNGCGGAGRFRFQLGYVCRHFNCGCHIADFHGNVDGYRLAGIQVDSNSHELREARFFRSDLIRARQKARLHVAAFSVGSLRLFKTCGFGFDGDFGTGDCSAGTICYPACDGAGRRLC